MQKLIEDFGPFAFYFLWKKKILICTLAVLADINLLGIYCQIPTPVIIITWNKNAES